MYQNLQVFEIMSMEKNCDYTIATLNNMAKDSKTINNPLYRPLIYFGAIVTDINTFSLLFDPPHKQTQGYRTQGLVGEQPHEDGYFSWW